VHRLAFGLHDLRVAQRQCVGILTASSAAMRSGRPTICGMNVPRALDDHVVAFAMSLRFDVSSLCTSLAKR